MIGTTETRFRGDPADVAPSHAEIHYLLGVLKHYFPRYRAASPYDIASSFAGLRVLPGGAGHAFHRSRETLLVPDRARRPRVLSDLRRQTHHLSRGLAARAAAPRRRPCRGGARSPRPIGCR